MTAPVRILAAWLLLALGAGTGGQSMPPALALRDLLSGPAVNGKGDYAVVRAASDGAVLLNGTVVEESADGAHHTHLALTGSTLLYSCLRPADEASTLVVVDLATRETRKVSAGGLVQRVSPTADDRFLVEIVTSATRSRDAFVFSPAGDRLRPLAATPGYDFGVTRGDDFNALTVEGNVGAVALFRALRAARLQIPLPVSASHNFNGRLSWGESYRIEGLVELYEKTRQPVFAQMARLAVANVLANDNRRWFPDAPDLPRRLWATKKYALDKTTPLNLLVDDAMIASALLAAVNAGVLTGEQRARAIAAAEQAFAYHEPAFRRDTVQYHFPRGIRFHVDGLWVPHNMQTTMGITAARLWKATGDGVYRRRAEAIAKKFRSEWEIDATGRVLWHYWPRAYYRGWTKADGVSVHLPSRAAAADSLYDDMSHAGLSVRFVTVYRELLGKDVFTDADVEGLRRSLRGATFEGTYSRFISGDTAYQPASVRFLPTYGWADLHEPGLRAAYAAGVSPIEGEADAVEFLAALAASAGGAASRVTIRSQHGTTPLDLPAMMRFLGY